MSKPGPYYFNLIISTKGEWESTSNTTNSSLKEQTKSPGNLHLSQTSSRSLQSTMCVE